MFGKKAKEPKKTVVKTKEELQAAIKRNESCIEIQGKLAEKLKWLKRLSKFQIAGLTALLATAVIPSPLTSLSAISFAAATPVVAIGTVTGGEIATIIMATGVSASLTLAVLKGYNAEIQPDRVVLTRK